MKTITKLLAVIFTVLFLITLPMQLAEKLHMQI